MKLSLRIRSNRASADLAARIMPGSSVAKPTAIPPYTLLTNDNGEPLHRELQLRGEALRFIHHGYRGLFGGIWRMGRMYFTHRFGACLGPEVCYPVGAAFREGRAASGESRAEIFAREAQVASDARRFVEPIAAEFGGGVFLDLVERSGDRHVLHVFLPASIVAARFTPRSWFLFWRIQDEKFHALRNSPDRKGAGPFVRQRMPLATAALNISSRTKLGPRPD